MNNLLIQQYGKYKRQQLDENPYSCLLDTSIDINPHQVDAFCVAVKALKTGGIILADEVGLGKTIEAGLVIKGKSSEQRFIHITKEFVNGEYVNSLLANLGEGQSLLVYGTKIQSGLRLPDNIVVKKIPKDLLDKCTFESEVK